MVGGAGRREAHRTGLNGFLREGAHAGKLVGGRLIRERALAHDVGAQRRVPNVARVVDTLRQRVDGVEELGEGLPGPLDARLHRLRRDVLGPFKVAEDEAGVGLRTRRQGETAVAHHDAGDAVVARARTERVPENLGIHVRVAVHEAGRHDVAFRVELPRRALPDASDADDATVLDGDIAPEPRACPRRR